LHYFTKKKKHNQLFTVMLRPAVCAVGEMFILTVPFSR